MEREGRGCQEKERAQERKGEEKRCIKDLYQKLMIAVETPSCDDSELAHEHIKT